MESTAPRTSATAITGFVLGLLGLVTCITAIPGLILGIVGLSEISKSQGELRGKGFAIAAIVLSCLSFVLVPFVLLPKYFGILLPDLGEARESARIAIATASLRQINAATHQYGMGRDGSYPPVDDWVNALSPYGVSATPLSWPGDTDQEPMWAMNEHLDGLRESDVSNPAFTVMFFEVGPGSPLAGGMDLMLAQPPRSRFGYIVGFADGSAYSLDPSEDMSWLIWNPRE